MTGPDEFVAVWEGPYLEGELIAAALERASIPFGQDAGLVAGQMRIDVPRAYEREARGVIASGASSLVPDTPEDLFGRPRGDGLRPFSVFSSRWVVAAIAVVVVVAIVLTYV